MRAHIQPIFQKHRINFLSISLRRRSRAEGVLPEEENLHTLLIDSDDEDPASWGVTAREMGDVFRIADITDEEIEIEICNQNKLYYNISEILPDDENLLDAMQLLKPRVLNVLMAFFALEWSSVAFHMRHSKANEDAPRVPTILVFFFPEAVLDFKTVESLLLKVLGQSKKSIKIELLRGLIDNAIPGTFGIIQRDIAKSTKPRNGSSIGIAGDKTTAGSLGSWLNLKFPAIPPYKVALTCHDVVTLDQNGRKRQIGKARVDFGAIDNKIAVEYPAVIDRITTLKVLNDDLKSRDPGAKEAFEVTESPHSNPIIGHVIAASGLRTNNVNRSMNWALIETPGTHTKNKPPLKNMFLRDAELPSPLEWDVGYHMTADSVVRQIGAVEKGSWVAKTGRTSRVTSGFVNRMDRVVNWAQYGGFHSEEIEVIGPGRDFAAGGDSGSMVTNSSGELVGILIGKDSCASDHGIGFFTPIFDIFRDVELQTGGVLSLDQSRIYLLQVF